MNNIFNRSVEIWKPSFLKKFFKEEGAKNTWLFWFFSNTVLAIVFTVLFMILLFSPLLDKSIAYLETETPYFEFQLKDSILSSNLEETEPFIMNPEDGDFILVLDTKHKIYTEDYVDEIENGILVTSTEVFFKDGEKYKITKFPFSEIEEDIFFTKTDAITFFENIKNKIFLIIGVAFFIAIWVFLNIIRLSLALLWAVMWFVLGKIFKIKELTFSKSYFAILNLYPISLLVDVIFLFTGFSIPFSSLIVFGVLFFLNTRQILKKSKQGEKKEAEEVKKDN